MWVPEAELLYGLSFFKQYQTKWKKQTTLIYVVLPFLLFALSTMNITVTDPIVFQQPTPIRLLCTNHSWIQNEAWYTVFHG